MHGKGASREGVDLFLDPGLFLDVLQMRSMKDGRPYFLEKPQWRECEVKEVKGRNILVQYLTEHMTEWINVDNDTGRLADLHERVLPQTQLDLTLGGNGAAGPSGARIPQPLIDALKLPKLTEAELLRNRSTRIEQLYRSVLDSAAQVEAYEIGLSRVTDWFTDSKKKAPTANSNSKAPTAAAAAMDDDDDDDVVLDDTKQKALSLSLFDPLTRCRLSMPVRSALCSHLQVFDLRTHIERYIGKLSLVKFINVNPPPPPPPAAADSKSSAAAASITALESREQLSDEWTCPVCACRASLDKLMVDHFVLHILNAIQHPALRAGGGGAGDAPSASAAAAAACAGRSRAAVICRIPNSAADDELNVTFDRSGAATVTSGSAPVAARKGSAAASSAASAAAGAMAVNHLSSSGSFSAGGDSKLPAAADMKRARSGSGDDGSDRDRDGDGDGNDDGNDERLPVINLASGSDDDEAHDIHPPPPPPAAEPVLAAGAAPPPAAARSPAVSASAGLSAPPKLVLSGKFAGMTVEDAAVAEAAEREDERLYQIELARQQKAAARAAEAKLAAAAAGGGSRRRRGSDDEDGDDDEGDRREKKRAAAAASGDAESSPAKRKRKAAAGGGGGGKSKIRRATIENPFDVNTVTARELRTIDGVGEVTAKRVVDERARIGGVFTNLKEIATIKGIGPGVWAKLKPYIRVGSAAAVAPSPAAAAAAH